MTSLNVSAAHVAGVSCIRLARSSSAFARKVLHCRMEARRTVIAAGACSSTHCVQAFYPHTICSDCLLEDGHVTKD